MRRLHADELGQRHRVRSPNHESPKQRLHHGPPGCRTPSPDRQPLRGHRQPRVVPAEARQQPDDVNARRSMRQHASSQSGKAGRAFDAAHRRPELVAEDDSHVLRRTRFSGSPLGSRSIEREDRQ